MQRGKDLYIRGERVKPSLGPCRSRRATVERQHVLNVNEFHRAKAFRGPWISFPNLMFMPISRLRACRHQAEIYFATHVGMQKQTIPIVWTYCRIGDRSGWRPWFRCKCGRRAGKLYKAGAIFACRKCCNLVYECQLKSAKGRLR